MVFDEKCPASTFEVANTSYLAKALSTLTLTVQQVGRWGFSFCFPEDGAIAQLSGFYYQS